jgi:eukaryotic-like serine/threonine-protein kinase
VDGKSLRQIIDNSEPMQVEQANELIRKIADGMAYCHKNDVVHRDLKPENIFVTDLDQPVIMDFGLALTKGAHRVTYSNLSATMGTPDYMSPEQIDGKRGDQRTDIYALGIIFYEMLTGHPPFTGDSTMVVMSQHLNNQAPRLDKVNTSISVAIAAIVARCLEKNPDDRFQSMEELINAIDHPESVDTSILNKKKPDNNGGPSLAILQTLRGIAIAFIVLAILVVLALFLQTLKH